MMAKTESPTSTIASNFQKASTLFLHAKSRKLVNQKSSFLYTLTLGKT